MLLESMIDIIERAPALLEDLITVIPKEILKKRRIRGKWSIHEHACHLAITNRMMIGRMSMFRDEDQPVVKPYIPGSTIDEGDLHGLDLSQTLQEFRSGRKELIQVIRQIPTHKWQMAVEHPEYLSYSPYIFLRHIMMHDHTHMYRIEELWLTKEEYLPQR